MLKKLYLKSNEILFYLFPISIVFSNFLANFTVFYLAIYGILVLIKKENSFLKNQVFYVLLLFWLYISIRSLFSIDVLYSLKSSVLLIRYFLFFLAITFILKSNSEIIKKFTIILSIFIFLIFIDSFYEFFSGKSILGTVDDINYRLSSFFAGRFVLGSYVSKLTLLLIIL